MFKCKCLDSIPYFALYGAIIGAIITPISKRNSNDRFKPSKFATICKRAYILPTETIQNDKIRLKIKSPFRIIFSLKMSSNLDYFSGAQIGSIYTEVSAPLF